MSQIFEALRKAETSETSRKWSRQFTLEPAERREGDRRDLAANIRVYGHGPGVGPFFEEHSVLNASETGALLLMRTAVVAGQKLLLINEAAEQVQECRVIRTSFRGSKELEVAVEFPNPRPEFWTRVSEQSDNTGVEKRKHPRVTLPRGMDIRWRARGESVQSKVQTISAGGVSIAVREPASKGGLLHLSFEVPAGEVIARAVVRHSSAEEMGVEFVAISEEARKRLDHLLRKLLR